MTKKEVSMGILRLFKTSLLLWKNQTEREKKITILGHTNSVGKTRSAHSASSTLSQDEENTLN